MPLHNEAEMSVLGVLMIAPECLADGVPLHPGDFADQRHQQIFRAVLDLCERNVPADLVTVTAELQSRGVLAEIGGAGYLAELVDFFPTVAMYPHYARLMKDASARRRLAATAREIARLAHEAETPGEALDQAEAALLGLRRHTATGGPVEIGALLTPALKDFDRLQAAGGGVTGVPTGFSDLDSLTSGLQAGDLILVAGRPSMGKTALGLNLAEHAAEPGRRVLFFSLEMSKDLLTRRLIASAARVDSHRARTGRLSPDDWRRLTGDAADKIRRLPLLIDDDSNLTVMEIRARARRAMREGGLALIVIDYLGLLRPVKAHQVREREVSEMSRSLKALAKELGVPVLLLAQLNRELEKGASPRRPVMSDLRESGSLEQDADLVLFPWREAAFCQACRQKNSDCGKGHFREAEIIIGKQRNGPLGSVHVAWLPEFTRFEPFARASREEGHR